ncbi:MAG: PDZ domain-containing protein [Myxococcales bacterium]|nr:PDZ domain-containing protein [Myxococcales bacterium]
MPTARRVGLRSASVRPLRAMTRPLEPPHRAAATPRSGRARARSVVGLAALLAGASGACVSPVRTAPLARVAHPRPTLTTPDDLIRVRFLSAVIPPYRRGGMAWDSDGGPDPALRLYVDGELVFSSHTVEDTLTPDFSVTVPGNLRLAEGGSEVRVELWDDDGALHDVIGVYRARWSPGHPAPGEQLRLALDGGAVVDAEALAPEAYRGTGITAYEARRGALRLRGVLPRSPAGRAGLRAGDAIVAIDGQPVGSLGANAAASALSQVGIAGGVVTVEREVGGERIRRVVRLDQGYVWPVGTHGAR